jgi:hypothetical protein
MRYATMAPTSRSRGRRSTLAMLRSERCSLTENTTTTSGRRYLPTRKCEGSAPVHSVSKKAVTSSRVRRYCEYLVDQQQVEQREGERVEELVLRK